MNDEEILEARRLADKLDFLASEGQLDPDENKAAAAMLRAMSTKLEQLGDQQRIG